MASEYDPLVVKTNRRHGDPPLDSRLDHARRAQQPLRRLVQPRSFLLLIITKQGNANVIDTVDRIYALLPELKERVPAGLDISVLTDRTQTIRASVHDMQLTLAATAVW